jgi:hypothetical protein
MLTGRLTKVSRLFFLIRTDANRMVDTIGGGAYSFTIYY